MNRIILFFAAFCFTCSTISAQDHNSFNYNKWKSDQEEKSKSDVERHTFQENLLKPTCLYANVFVQAGHVHGPGVTLGGYLKNINLEASYIYGLSESYQVERLFADAHHSFTYMPMYLGAKFGYGIDLFGCLRITPQVGIGNLNIRGKQANETTTRSTESCNVTCLSGSVNIMWAFTKYFGLVITPEYQTKIGNTNEYNMFTDTTGTYVSKNSSTKDIVNWTKGFRIRFGLQISF